MKKLPLNGIWSFRAVDPHHLVPPSCRRALRWMPASVPGTVHTDLMANGLLQDPFYRMQENDAQWVESVQWVYRRRFDIPPGFLDGSSVELAAGGLDTYATLRCNGRFVARTDNMFVEYRFPVKRWLREGPNVLEILFGSPVACSKKLERKHGRLRVALESHRVYARKAQYSFSWDWGPKLTTSGIWRDIVLEASSGARLVAPFAKILSVSSSPREARVQFTLGVRGRAGRPLALRLCLEGPLCALSYTRPIRSAGLRFTVRVPNPHLWWPSGQGAQPLYTAAFTLVSGEEVLDEQRIRFGIRTVRLLQERDPQGKSFVMEVNGRRIFCKGADWIPADSFIPRIPSSTYERLLQMAKDAHMNMIRVWGGGFYEQDIFYDLCDRLGLLVWQDFMFACGEYPEIPAFLHSVRVEAEQAVVRLRNHPSIALWCGNNECEWLFCNENPDKAADDMRGATIFRDLLPSVVRTLDGTRPYWRSSPYGRGLPNAESNGNHHQWSVWSLWKDYPAYEEDNARFVTEFGFQAPAGLKTLEEMTLPGDRYPQSPVLEHHNKQTEGQERLFRFLAAHHLLPRNLDEFVFKSQCVQGEALKCAAEHWRRRKYATAGVLFWQLNDCWPVISWSVIDSRLRPKAGYYYARRFYAPLLVSFKRAGSAIEVWLTSDLPVPVEGELNVTLRSFAGDVVWTKKLDARAGPDSSRRRMIIGEEDLKETLGRYLLARFPCGSGRAVDNRLYFGEPKHLLLPDPGLRWSVGRSARGGIDVTVGAKRLARNVCLAAEGLDLLFEDNWFDCDAGTERTVHCMTEVSVDLFRRRLRVSSLR